jgi:hypothetical protein
MKRSLQLVALAAVLVLLAGTTGCLDVLGPLYLSGYNFSLDNYSDYLAEVHVSGPGIPDIADVYTLDARVGGAVIGLPQQGRYDIKVYKVGYGGGYLHGTAEVTQGGANPHYAITSAWTWKRVD